MNEIAAIIVGASGTKILDTVVRSSLGLQYFLLGDSSSDERRA
jgi:hypothetical protein